jgi:hypothetical protein
MNFADSVLPPLDAFGTIYTVGIPFLAVRNLPMSQNRRNALTAILFVALRFVAPVKGLSIY